jgi:hypothetical protein
MTVKVNGAAYTGIWVERKVVFVKLTFSKDISALAAADLRVLGTATSAGANTVADATFGVVESALVQALKVVDQKATILGVSKYHVSSKSVDVMLGHAEGWFSNNVGVVATDLPISNAQAVVTTAGDAPTNVVGALVSVAANAVTVGVSFAAFNGAMAVATAEAGDLATGPGATSGATPTNSPTGTAGFYPV